MGWRNLTFFLAHLQPSFKIYLMDLNITHILSQAPFKVTYKYEFI